MISFGKLSSHAAFFLQYVTMISLQQRFTSTFIRLFSLTTDEEEQLDLVEADEPDFSLLASLLVRSGNVRTLRSIPNIAFEGGQAEPELISAF